MPAVPRTHADLIVRLRHVLRRRPVRQATLADGVSWISPALRIDVTNSSS